MANKTMRNSRNTTRRSRNRSGSSRRYMRKNKTMKGGWINSTRQMFGSMLRNNNNTQFGRKLLGNPGNSGIGPATSNRRRSAMNPQQANMAKNVMGTARGMFDRFTNKSPGMSLIERIRREAEHVNEMAKDGRLAKAIDNSPIASKIVNNSFNGISDSGFIKSLNGRISKFSTGR